MKLLYVDDNPIARSYIERGLSDRGFTVDEASDGTAGLARAQTGAYDLLILDVAMPGIDGFELVRRLRSEGIQTPVLFLSSRAEARDRIRGLDLGADDYLVKPFAFGELVARIRAISRRTTAEPSDGRLRVADLEIDLNRHQAMRSGRPLALTPKEFALLEYLARNAGHVLSRGMIIEKVWGYAFESYSNLIDVHINNLRKKVDRDTTTKLIHTVKGVGYILEARDCAGDAPEPPPG